VAVAVDAGLIERLARILSPVTRWLFGKQTPEVNSLIATNLGANIIGAGAAATPAAIEAIEKMATPNQTRASTPMIMLFVLSATSLQVIPTTVIGIMDQAGAKASGSIILPTILVSAISTIVGVIFVKILGARKKSGNPHE
jgi:spore maturation protein A